MPILSAKGLQVLPAVEEEITAHQSQAANDGIISENVYATLDTPFLLKHVRYIGIWRGLQPDANPIHMICQPETSANLETAFETEGGNQTPGNIDEFARRNLIIWNSIFCPAAQSGGRPVAAGGDISVVYDSGWISLGKKGIPFMEVQGPVEFVYNPGEAWAADVIKESVTLYRGIFLE